MKIIGYYIDKPEYRLSLRCLLGFHVASKYVFIRDNGKYYFICRRCGKRYEVIN